MWQGGAQFTQGFTDPDSESSTKASCLPPDYVTNAVTNHNDDNGWFKKLYSPVYMNMAGVTVTLDAINDASGAFPAK